MKKTKEKTKQTQGLTGVAVILCMAIINVILGVVMLFVKQIEIKTLCYILITLLIILGFGLIIKYLMTESYKNINQYGFSVGTLFVILGICGLLKVDEVAGYFIVCLGIWLLASAVIKLQYALDLKALKDMAWGFLLVVSAVIAICAICVIINPFSEDTYHTYFTYIVLTADGILSLISTTYLALRIKKYAKQLERQDVQNSDQIFEVPENETGNAAEDIEQNKEENIEEGKEDI